MAKQLFGEADEKKTTEKKAPAAVKAPRKPRAKKSAKAIMFVLPTDPQKAFDLGVMYGQQSR